MKAQHKEITPKLSRGHHRRRLIELLAAGLTKALALMALIGAATNEAKADSWASTGSLNTARGYHTATLLPNGKVLVAGGANGGPSLATVELYDPATGAWTTTGTLNTGRS